MDTNKTDEKPLSILSTDDSGCRLADLQHAVPGSKTTILYRLLRPEAKGLIMAIRVPRIKHTTYCRAPALEGQEKENESDAWVIASVR
jgi:hypothetical protein